MEDREEARAKENDGKPREGRSVLQTRRQFLEGFAGLVGAVGAIEFAYPLMRSFTPVQRGEAEPVIVSLEEVPPGSVRPILYGGSPSLLLHRPEGILAVSLVCTHLGCIVKWDGQRQRFQCPCHDGFFDQTGKVISGPPPAPLEPLDVKIMRDKLIVGASVST